jgi:TonB family protein
MDRLQKKCVIVSAGSHLLLATLFLVGPAFVSSKNRSEDLPVLDFVPAKTVDALVSGGGNPNAKPPAAEPEAPPKPPEAPPVTEPPKIEEPTHPQDPIKPVEPARTDPDPSWEPPNKPTHKKIEVSTVPVVRKRDFKAEAAAAAAAQAQEKAREYAALRGIEKTMKVSATSIGNSVSGGTSIELRGPGGGGVPYANFLQAVKTVYQNAWMVPDGVTDDDATTRASVTIARDGTVVSSRIIRSSGNRDVDLSVQHTLDRVTFAAPLPEDAKEDQRTVEINFNVRAKRALG